MLGRVGKLLIMDYHAAMLKPYQMKNPYIELHNEFRKAGADVLLSSGQACVVFGIAAFSKDGDWIVRETEVSCTAILDVLKRHGAQYRLGVPLHPNWLALGLTSHFEFLTDSGFRMRTDFCSRPPRVSDRERMWNRAMRIENIDVVDVESLVQLKQTRRLRDYSIIGALAEVAGLEGNSPELALTYLQDYELLARAVKRWPVESVSCGRRAVQLLVKNAARSEVVSALAIEQDDRMQEDQRRIDHMQSLAANYVRDFTTLRAEWRKTKIPLLEQHRQLLILAEGMLEAKS
jgi:hypothetical protein